MPESFELDHTQVIAPYIRLAGHHQYSGRKTTIKKYDVRLLQPNVEFASTGALHTLEHLMSVYLRHYLNGVIDFSPMGCRTGFYLVLAGNYKIDNVRRGVRRALEDCAVHDDVIPGCSLYQCGNYRDHDLQGAFELCDLVLRRGIRIQKTVHIPDNQQISNQTKFFLDDKYDRLGL